ncbi:MAG: DNA-binding protein [Bacteroides sp.]|nr:DNA-binding protein [Bacteroides sp.]
MAKYVKQEMNDLNGSGKKRAYYRLETIRNLSGEEFIEIMAGRHAGVNPAIVKQVLYQAAEDMAFYMAMGYTVTLDSIGTFRPSLGMRRGKQMEAMEEGSTKRNAQSICVNDINFKPAKRLIKRTNDECELERAGTNKLHRSPYTKEERLKMAQEFLGSHPFMRVRDYIVLTGLSRTTASTELREFSQQPDSGIGWTGSGSSKLYIAKRINE